MLYLDKTKKKLLNTCQNIKIKEKENIILFDVIKKTLYRP